MSSAHDLEIHYGRQLLQLAHDMGWHHDHKESALAFVLRANKLMAQAEIADRVLEEGVKLKKFLEHEFAENEHELKND